MRILIILSICMLATNMKAAHDIIMFPNPNSCATSYPTAYSLGDFSIGETSIHGTNGFTKGQTNVTLVLDFACSNFQFKSGTGVVSSSGSEVTINSYTITSSSITVNLTTSSLNNQYNRIYFENIEVRSTGSGSCYIRRNGGTMKIENSTTSPSLTTSWGDLDSKSPQTYSSSEAYQEVTSDVFMGQANQEIIAVEVVVTGSCSPLNATEFMFNTTGTIGSTNPTTDIARAKLWYTGTTNAFATDSLFGTKTSPNGAFSITGNTQLKLGAGTYYFWLTYDINPQGTATNLNYVDAKITDMVLSGNTYSVSSGNPVGQRQISNNIFYSIKTGNWNDTSLWSNASGGASCGCAPVAGSGLVYVNHTVAVNNIYSVDEVVVQNGGHLYNTGSNALVIDGNLITTGNGNFSISGPWAVNNVTLTGTGISEVLTSTTFLGHLKVGKGTSLELNGASGANLTVRGNLTINGTLDLNGRNLTNSHIKGIYVSGTGLIDGTGTATFGVDKEITPGSDLTIAAVWHIGNGKTTTNNGTVLMQNNITGGNTSSTWKQGENATLTMGGSSSALLSTGTLSASAVGNTVIYSATSAQNIKGSTYYNIIFKNSAKTLTNYISVYKDLTLESCVKLDVSTNNYAIEIYGDWINNSCNSTPFVYRAGTVYFYGYSEIKGSTTSTFDTICIMNGATLKGHASLGKFRVAGSWINNGTYLHNTSDVGFACASTTGGFANGSILGTSTTRFHTLVVDSAKSLNLHNIFTEFAGHITNNGNLLHNNGTAVFCGLGNTQRVGGKTISNEFYNVDMSNYSGGMKCMKPIRILNQCALNAGNIISDLTNILKFTDTLVLIGGSDISFVNGPLCNETTAGAGSSSITKFFPIGKEADYRPATLYLNYTGAALCQYTAELHNLSATDLNFSLPPGVLNVSDIHYYIITQDTNTNFSHAKCKLTYGANDIVTDANNLVICKNLPNATAWYNVGGYGTAPTNGSITCADSFTLFYYFCLGNMGANPLPVELVDFNARKREPVVNINWSTASQVNTQSFTVERSPIGSKFETLITMAAAGNSNTMLNYATVDARPFMGKSFYRLKITDFDQSVSYSKAVMVEFSPKLVYNVYPNPSTGNTFNISMPGISEYGAIVTVTDLSGRLQYEKTFMSEDGNFGPRNIRVEKQLSPGTYLINIIQDGDKFSSKLIVN